MLSIGSIQGRSMQPTLNPNSNELKKDLVLMNKWKASPGNFKKGQVVALRSPTNPDNLSVKRIIALSGEKAINAHAEEITVPVGHIFVEGDEKTHSIDSRCYGPVSEGLVVAVITHILYPFNRFGPILDKSINVW